MVRATEAVNGVEHLKVQKRYQEERDKRLRPDGDAQFINISQSDKFQHFKNDPWIDASKIKDARTFFPNNRCQILILGAGWGGLCYAVRMIQAGIRPEEIRMVDMAGGFGGTWYYNRYPGLTCDLESYSYLPFLEEMGYMPKYRYASGEEIRNYANLVAEKFNLTKHAVFQTTAEKLEWDEANKEWQVQILQTRTGTEEPPQRLNIRSQFVTMTGGVLNHPKLPGVPGIANFQGDTFHSARFDYSITGGSPADPCLEKLKDKRVAVIGTGASAIQIVPYVARYAKDLYVVQRTPASIGIRDQWKTDPEWFRREVANIPGWQRERCKNFNQQFTTGKRPANKLGNDGISNSTGLVVFAGNPYAPLKVEELPAYIQTLHDIDLPRMTLIRDRVKDVVKDPSVAEKLQPWFPTWCKRPCFNDEYLETFNRKNTKLLDTAGRGLDNITSDSLVVAGQSYPVDLIIFSTGFTAPIGGSPATKANVSIIGRNSVSMAKEWDRNGPSTLHAVLDANFPNLFLSGPWQGTASANYIFNIDCLAKHAAYILTTAKSRVKTDEPFAVAPTVAAVEDWGQQILNRSVQSAAIMGCTPSYFNLEGEVDKIKPEDQLRKARGGLWGTGLESFLDVVENWRAEGSMHGIELRV